MNNKNGGRAAGLSNNKQGALVKTGKLLCKVLRHQPEMIGIKPDGHGFVKVDELISKMPPGHALTREKLEETVRCDPKTRYSFSADGTMIRCNYGHSYPVDLGYVALTPPDILYHGTAERFRASIEEKGILPMSRQYVHLSADTDMARTVGARHGQPVIFIVRAAELFRDGHDFYLASDRIWLTDSVPPRYLIAPDK